MIDYYWNFPQYQHGPVTYRKTVEREYDEEGRVTREIVTEETEYPTSPTKQSSTITWNTNGLTP